MNHLCFIVDNSLTMQQQPYHAMTLLDTVKSAIQNAIHNLSRLGFPNPNQHIHLFVTSSPNTPLSSFQHDQSHLAYQIKSIAPSLDTDPATTIQSALNRISYFRLLTQTQTLLGYRQAYIFQPALIILFTDRMTKRKIQRIVNFIEEGKIHMRSEYQLVTYIVSQPSFSERNVLTEQIFKSNVENQKDLGVLIEAFRKINGQTKFSLHPENLTNFVWSRIENYKPFLFFHMQLKEIKKKVTEFAPSERGSLYFRSWQHLPSIPFQLSPFKLWKIPLPFDAKCTQENGELKIEKLAHLHFYLDLTKKFTDVLSTIMPENRYKVLQNPFFSMLQGQKIQESYPIFFQHKNSECLVGLLSVSPRGTEAIFFFGNFTHLNGILRNIESQKYNQKQIQSSIYPYLVGLPAFYLKFLKILFDKLRLEINYSAFENINNSQNHNWQARLETSRGIDKKNLAKMYQINLQQHKNNKSQCCLIYSPKYQVPAHQEKYTEQQLYFNDLLQELLDVKAKLGIEDYFTSTQIQSTPVTKEIQKYSTIKRVGDDQFNQNISFGNPYKKKRKLNQSQKQRNVAAAGKNGRNQAQINKDDAVRRNEEKVFESQPEEKRSQNHQGNVREQLRFNSQVDRNNSKPESAPTQKLLKADPRKQKLRQKTQGLKTAEPMPTPTTLETQSYIPCQTVQRINAMPVDKALQVSFSLQSIATAKMLQNQQTIRRFLSSLSKM